MDVVRRKAFNRSKKKALVENYPLKEIDALYTSIKRVLNSEINLYRMLENIALRVL